MNSAAKKTYFTLVEANRMLPLVRAIVQDIVNLYKDVHERRERLSRFHTDSSDSDNEESSNDGLSLYTEEVKHMEAELELDINRLEAYVTELQELGVEMKDAVAGLVDFPTQVDGREAYLCWRLGEDEIAYWHELDAGFQGRQSLLEGSAMFDDSGDGDDSGSP